jgi:transcriptional regulator with XRE-family HTH domain
VTAPRRRDELARTLVTLRKAAGMTAAQVARAAGFSAPKVSRFESGRQIPSAEEAEAYARAVRASAADRRRLVTMAAELRDTMESRLVLLRPGSGGARRMQDRIAREEARANHICSFANTLVPGLCQTADYARAVFASVADLPEDEVESAVAGRLARQAQARQPSHRRYTQIITEGALNWHVGRPELMAAQCDHLAELARIGDEQFRVGVIPMSQPVTQFPMEAFDLFDADAVLMGSYTATAYMTQPTDVEAYRRLFEDLVGHARFDAAAAVVFDGLATRYRSLGTGPD